MGIVSFDRFRIELELTCFPSGGRNRRGALYEKYLGFFGFVVGEGDAISSYLIV